MSSDRTVMANVNSPRFPINVDKRFRDSPRRTLAQDRRQSSLLLSEAVVCATPADIPGVARLAGVHAAGLPWRHTLAADAGREPALRTFAATLARYALTHGHVDHVLSGRAATIWLDRTAASSTFDDLEIRLAAICGEPTRAMRQAITAAAAVHRQRGPHVYLAALMTVDRRDTRTLLAHRHRILDRIGVTACTDAATPEAVAGLVVAGYWPGQPYQLPGGPTLWPMTRPPHAGERRQTNPATAG